MKIIDLLNKIANGEEIQKFWWNGCIHEVEKEYGTNKYSIFDTYCKKYKKIELEDLNEEIKFIEEKKIPGKINNWTSAVGRVDDSNIEEYVHKLFEQQTILYFKINSIIDCLKKE